MPVIHMPVRWIESVIPWTKDTILLKVAITPAQMQATLNAMAEVMSEQAWREMVEKSFGERE